MSHRFFRNQNNVPMSGWVGEACGVVVRGTSFGNLVRVMRDVSTENGCGSVYEDEVARSICQRNNGFCWGTGTGSGATVASANPGGGEVRQVVKRRGCGRCGGGAIR